MCRYRLPLTSTVPIGERTWKGFLHRVRRLYLISKKAGGTEGNSKEKIQGAFVMLRQWLVLREGTDVRFPTCLLFELLHLSD